MLNKQLLDKFECWSHVFRGAILTLAVERVEGVVAGGMREVAQLIQVLLLLAHVPVQALGERVEPVGDLVGCADRRHRVDRRRHPQAETSDPLVTNTLP